MAEQVFQLFVSSPGDVAGERRRMEAVVERLNGEFGGRARFIAIRWETSYYSAHETFQDQIPEAKDCDLVVSLFATRLGTALPDTFKRRPSGGRYESGTAYETLSAIEARQAGKPKPDIYVFRCPTPPVVAIDDPNEANVRSEWDRLNQFFETNFHNANGQFIAAYQEFVSVDDFAAKIEDCLRQWLARNGFVTRDPIWDWRVRGSPFPGLEAFDKSRSDLFFGRDLVTAHALGRLKEAADRDCPFLLLIGASGSGKSSLLRASLLPRIVVPGTFPAVDLWRTVYFTPGQNPMLSLADALFDENALGAELREGEFPTKELLADVLAGEPVAAIAPIQAAMLRAAKARAATYGFSETHPCRLAIGLDQAERLALEIDPKIASVFTNLIEALVLNGLAFVVTAIRSDAYARFQLMDGFRRLNAKGAAVDILPPDLDELEEAITKPVGACRPELTFEMKNDRSLADVLVADANCGSPLPLLQMALTRLFQGQVQRQDGVLRYEDYPGLAASVTETAADLLAKLDAEARAEVPALIAALAHDVAADPVTGALTPVVVPIWRNTFEKGRVSRTNLVDTFIRGRLLSTEGYENDVRVRPTHDALLSIWPEAVRILHEFAPIIRVRHILEPIVREWDGAPAENKADYTDLSPALAGAAQRLLETFADDLPPRMRDFINEAVAAQEVRQSAAAEENAVKERVKAAEALARANKWIIRLVSGGMVVTTALLGLLYLAETKLEVRDRQLLSGISAVTNDTNEVISRTARSFRSASGIPIGLIKDIIDPIRHLQDEMLRLGAASPELRAGKAATLDDTAVTYFKLGDSSQALEAAKQSRDILRELLVAEPSELDWQDRALSADVKVADALKSQGALDLALQTYQASTATATALSQQFPRDSRWIHWLAICENKAGEVFLEQGNFAEARKIYSQGMENASSEAESVTKQRDVAWAHASLARSLLTEGSFADAIKEAKRGLQMRTELIISDSKDTSLSQELASSYNDLGDAQASRGGLDEADASYRAAATIIQTLATSDKANAEWQHLLSISFEKRGDIDAKRNRTAEAVGQYSDSLGIRAELVRLDPRNLDWELDLARIQWKLASLGDNTNTRLQTLVEMLTRIRSDGKLPFTMVQLLSAASDRLSNQTRN